MCAEASPRAIDLVSKKHRVFENKSVISRFRRENWIHLLDNRQPLVGRWALHRGFGEIYVVVRQVVKAGDMHRFGKFSNAMVCGHLVLVEH